MAPRRGPFPGFLINFETPKINVRDERGRFTSAQATLYRQNQQIAYAMQTQVARIIDTNIVRQKVKSGRLVQATLDRRNSVYNYDFAGIGDPEFLDRSIAKYWRTIEEGSAKTWTKRSFLSLELQGLWGLNTSSWRRSASGNEWAALGGKTRKADYARQEMYHPFRYGKGANLPVFHPSRQIQPMGAYKYVAQSPQYTGMAVEHGRQFIERVMGRGISPPGFRGGAYG